MILARRAGRFRLAFFGSLSALACSVTLFLNPIWSLAQVGPAEMKDPHLKAIEQTYLTQMVAVNQAIAAFQFPFGFSLNRYVGLAPKEQIGADARGLEFVSFHGQTVLKLSGNYNAAFNADHLTPNQRSGRVFDEVILPILRCLPEYFKSDADFDAFGFEISYHVRKRAHGYDYEGKEILVAVLDRADGLNYSSLRDESKRQEILNRSEIFLDGKPFGLALGAAEPFDAETLARSLRHISAADARREPAAVSHDPDPGTAEPAQNRPFVAGNPTMRQTLPQTKVLEKSSAAPDSQPSAPEVNSPVDALQSKYQAQLDALAREGAAKYHFVDYAPPSFVIFHNQVSLQLTIRNPNTFDREGTSIYRRAAQSFDLFLAPELKPIVDSLPAGDEFGFLDVTIINGLTSKSAGSSEALEFVFPLDPLRKFANADITNQELINQSVVMVNGVRIALNLQQVE